MESLNENSVEIKRLKEKLKREHRKRQEAVFLKNQLYDLLKEQDKKLEEYKLENENIKQKFKDEIESLCAENIKLKDELFVCSASKDKLDDVYKDLNRIHIRAETLAQDLVDDAKGKVMEIFFVVDKINSYLDSLKKDMMILEKDLSIGTATMEERIDVFYKDIDKYKNKLNEMKIKFYKENHVPLD